LLCYAHSAFSVDKNRAFFLHDGAGYYATYIPKDDLKPIKGFVVPNIKGKNTELFYIESYITFTAVIKNPKQLGKIVPDTSVGDKYPTKDIIMILRNNKRSIIIPLEAKAEDGTFQPDDAKRKPVKGVLVPAANGNPDEFYPIEDDGTL